LRLTTVFYPTKSPPDRPFADRLAARLPHDIVIGRAVEHKIFRQNWENPELQHDRPVDAEY
jgi:hypothetical protein